MTQAFTLESFSGQNVHHLEETLPQQQVLSAIFNVDPHRAENHGSGLMTRARNAFKTVAAPESLLQTVLDDLPNARVEGGRSRAYFLWDEHGHVRGQALEIPLMLPEKVHFGAPEFSPLEFALQARPRTAMVLIDREWGRIFEVNLGRISELKRLENVLDGRHFLERDISESIAKTERQHTDPHEDSQRRLLERNNDFEMLARNLADQDRRFVNAVARALEAIWHEQDFERLIIAGSFEAIAALQAQLPVELQQFLAGEFQCRGNTPVSQVLAKAHTALEQAQTVFELNLIAQAHQDGVRGTVETLEVLQEGRVHHLLVPFDGANIPVWRETGPNPYLFGQYPPQGQSPLSGQAVERVALRDVLLELRDRFGLKVSLLEGDAAHRLELEMGGLAGLLRH